MAIGKYNEYDKTKVDIKMERLKNIAFEWELQLFSP